MFCNKTCKSPHLKDSYESIWPGSIPHNEHMHKTIYMDIQRQNLANVYKNIFDNFVDGTVFQLVNELMHIGRLMDTFVPFKCRDTYFVSRNSPVCDDLSHYDN